MNNSKIIIEIETQLEFLWSWGIDIMNKSAFMLINFVLDKLTQYSNTDADLEYNVFYHNNKSNKYYSYLIYAYVFHFKDICTHNYKLIFILSINLSNE